MDLRKFLIGALMAISALCAYAQTQTDTLMLPKNAVLVIMRDSVAARNYGKTIVITDEETECTSPSECSLPAKNQLPDGAAVVRYDASDVNDSIPEFKRHLESTEFIPKGQWITGISVNYTQSDQNKYQFLVLQNISGDTYTFKISPMVAFAVKADLALGGRFAYSRALTKLESADIVLDSETSYDINNLYRLNHSYSGMAIMRNYFSLGRSKRFGIFTELQLELGGGQSKIMKGKGTDITGTYERDFHFNIGLAPGMSIFVSNYSAIEVNVGLLGFGLNNSKLTSDRIYVSRVKSRSANFNINLFSITFGMTFYL